MKCVHYAGNQYCNLHKSKVASAYCGDICKDDIPPIRDYNGEKNITFKCIATMWPDNNIYLKEVIINE